MKRLLLFCSGANLDVLGECPEEEGKYAGIGATVLGTAVLASLSGGYAFYTVFRAVPWAISFGALWGLVIFNLDRLIVSTMRRQKTWMLELAAVSPRLALAVLIGVVIARPLELKLYEREILAEITRANNVFYREAVREVDAGFVRLEVLEEQNARLRRETEDRRKEVDAAYQAAISEAEGTAGTRRLGRGPVFTEKWQRLEELKEQLGELESRHRAQATQNDREIARLRHQRQQQIDRTASRQAEANGMLAQLEALERLGKASPAARDARLFITMLFICVEVCPVLAKLMSGMQPYRPYEQRLEDRELRHVEESERFRQVIRHELEVQAQQRISNFNDQVNTELQLSTDQNRAQRELQLQANTELMQRIADAQVEIASKYVDAWKQQELQKLAQRSPWRSH